MLWVVGNNPCFISLALSHSFFITKLAVPTCLLLFLLSPKSLGNVGQRKLQFRTRVGKALMRGGETVQGGSVEEEEEAWNLGVLVVAAAVAAAPAVSGTGSLGR